MAARISEDSTDNGKAEPLLQSLDLYKSGRAAYAEKKVILTKIVPPLKGDFNLRSFMNALEAIDIVNEMASFEIAATEGSVTMYVRASSDNSERILTTLESHYPDIRFESVKSADPLLFDEDTEIAYRQVLYPAGDEWLPFQVNYDATGLLEYGSDPFIDMIGGLSGEIQPGSRVVSRLLLSQQPHDWSEEWRSRALKGSGSENQMLLDTMRREERELTVQESSSRGSFQSYSVEYQSQMQFIYLLAILMGLGTLVFIAHKWLFPIWEQGLHTQVYIYGSLLMGAMLLVGLIVLFIMYKTGYFKPDPEPQFYDPDLVRLRIEGAAFRMELHLCAVTSEHRSGDKTVNRILMPTIAAYRSFDNPMGCRFAATPLEQLSGNLQGDDLLSYIGGTDANGTARTGVIGTREAAAFWHVPGSSADTPSLERGGSLRIRSAEDLYSSSVVHGLGHSVPIGIELYRDSGRRLLSMPPDTLRGHHLYVARTRMGKSTLMLHVASGIINDIVGGYSNSSMVVIDPHSDLVTDILNTTTEDAGRRVYLIDVSDTEKACGINLLDTRIFTERDLTIPVIIAIAKTSSENWGDRMEAIMTWTFNALYEANRHRPAAQQYTIFDAVPFLTDEETRKDIIEEGMNTTVAEWWNEVFPTLVNRMDQSAIAPVLRKIGDYYSSEAARRVLGQRQCTIDIGEVITSGNVLLVDTARGEAGPEVAAIIGASILNLTEFVIRKQGSKPPEERRRVTVIVDEMQTLTGVRFDDMLAELGKYGCNLIMATQSLDRLNEMSESRNMRETIFANISCLMAFQVNALDATLLRKELKSDAIDEEDITSLPPHHCYGRITLPAGAAYFSMELLPPIQQNDDNATFIRQASEDYTTPSEDIDRIMQYEQAEKTLRYFSSNGSAALSEEETLSANHGNTQDFQFD